MPDRPTWISRIPAILAWLDSPEAPPFLHRGLIETVFQLRRRQAVRLLEAAGGYHVGRSYLVDTPQLAQYVRAKASPDAVERALVGKRRLEDRIEEARRAIHARSVRVRVPPGIEDASPGRLPSGVERLFPGRLEISYLGSENLISKLAELISLAAHDPVAFQATFE